jgi:hypothetical protein
LPPKRNLIRYDAKRGKANMDVSIKSFDVAMDVKNNGIEMEIREPNGGTRLGDLIVAKGHLIWCAGKTSRAKGKKVKWTEFITFVNTLHAPTKKASAKKTVIKKVAKNTAAKAAAPAPATE